MGLGRALTGVIRSVGPIWLKRAPLRGLPKTEGQVMPSQVSSVALKRPAMQDMPDD